MGPIFARTLAFALLALSLSGSWAEALLCNTTPAQFATQLADQGGTNWTVQAGTVLCKGTYNVPGTMILGINRTLYIGDDQDVRIIASVVRLSGQINADATGGGGGIGCLTTAGGAGAGGSGAGAGGGAAAFIPGNNAQGGSGGGGAGHGNGGGAGGLGTGSAIPGQNGVATGSLDKLNDLTLGSGGGGSGCSSQRFGTVISGADGGRGGGMVYLEAKDLDVRDPGAVLGPAVTTSGANGAAFLFVGIAVGASSGGGSGGTIVLYATEQLSVAGSLRTRGGNGANAGRDGGGGGGAAGGRVKLYRPTACTPTKVEVNGGTRGTSSGSGQAGEPGGNGTSYCANIQVAPSITAVTASPASVNEGQSSTITVTAEDVNGHLLKYAFDCEGDGTYEIGPQLAASAVCPFPESGSKAVKVRVTDWNSIAITVPATPAPSPGVAAGTYAAGTFAFGGATLATLSPAVVVTNLPPGVTATIPTTANEGSIVTFGAAITDSPGDVAAKFGVVWSWGDATSTTAAGVATPQSLTHSYADGGTFAVKVTVTDRDGGLTETTGSITIANVAPTAVLGALPVAAVVATPYTFTATATDPSPADTAAGFTYTFTFQRAGDAALPPVVVAATGNGGGASVQNTFATAGSWTISVTATDKDGAVSAPASGVLNVQQEGVPAGPVVTIAPASLTLAEGSQASVSATWIDPNYPDNAQPFSFQWRWGDATANTNGGPTASPTFTSAPALAHTYAESGNFSLQLAVTDVTNQVGLGAIPVTVSNVPPIPTIAGNVTGTENVAVTVQGGASDLSPGDTAAGFTYTWSWGDGTPNTVVTGTASSSTTHVYVDSGSYDFKLTATDRDGGVSGQITRNATIGNTAPAATLTAPATGDEGASLAFSLAVTDPSPADTAAGFTVEWDFGDSSPKETGAGFLTRSHVYKNEGSFTVTVKVTDQDAGAVTRTAVVAVANKPPLAKIVGGDRRLARRESVTFGATVTDPGINDTFTYAWNFGDSGTSTAAAPSHAWTANGTYTVTVIVTDNAGASVTDTIVVTVANRLPVASVVVVAPAAPRSTEDLTLTFTYTDADGDVESGTTIAWFVDGGPVASLAGLRVVPEASTVRGQIWHAEVTPKDGANAGLPVRSNEVTIGNEAPTAAAVVLAPAAPRAADSLTVTWTFADSDGDLEDGTRIRWTRGGAAQPAFDDKKSVPSPLVKGNVWIATVTPRDGALDGAPVVSPPVTVGNTTPAITRLDDVAKPAEGLLTNVSWTIVASDVDGDALQYACTKEGAPIGTGATQSAAFAVGTYTIDCTATDGLETTADSLTIAVGDVPPIVDAGSDQTVDPGRPRVTAVGRDTLNRALTYAWTVVSSPAPVALATPGAASTDFLAKKAGDYVLKVTVDNGIQPSEDTVKVTVRNVAPSAVIEPGVVTNARELDPITLSGLASSDANGDVVTFRWTQLSGVTVEFPGSVADTNVTFVPRGSGDAFIRLTVTDEAGNTSDATAQIRVSPFNPGGNPPVARAGLDQRVLLGETVRLDGSGSYDPDGSAGLSFNWQITSGQIDFISGAELLAASFTPNAVGVYTVRLSVFDGTFSAADTVEIVVADGGGNHRPVAVIDTAALTVGLDDVVLLDGRRSSDEDAGTTLTYRWLILPGGQRPTLAGADKGLASFVAVTLGEVRVQLTVSDGRLDSLPVHLTIAVGATDDLPPVAVAQGPSTGRVSTAIELDGSESSDPEGKALLYVWRQTGGPNARLEGASSAKATFTPSSAGTYLFELVVSDGRYTSAPAAVAVEVVENGLPLALARLAELRPVNWVEEPIGFDGSASSDPENEPLTYAWRQIGGPPATLTGADTATPTFTPSQNGFYSFELVVRDGQNSSAPSTLQLSVENFPAVEGGCGCTAGGSLGAFALLGLAGLARRRRRSL